MKTKTYKTEAGFSLKPVEKYQGKKMQIDGFFNSDTQEPIGHSILTVFDKKDRPILVYSGTWGCDGIFLSGTIKEFAYIGKFEEVIKFSVHNVIWKSPEDGSPEVITEVFD